MEIQLDNAQKEFFELMQKKEDLHEDLLPYIENTSTIGPVIRHPLYYELFYHPQRNAVINRGYLAKKSYVEKKLKEKNYTGVLVLYERPYRLEKFCQFRNELTDEQYWDTLAWIWTDSENLWQYGPILGMLLNSDRPQKEKMMTEDEANFLANLPEEFTIYRGHHGHNKSGYSWTLSYTRALWFARRWEGNYKKQGVLKATVKKTDVIALLMNRKELEIVVDPSRLTKVKSIKNKKKRPKWLQDILDEAVKNFKLGENTDHGLHHWEQVERNALALAKHTKGCNKLVVQLFALLHDCKRENEYEDPDHGKRAALYIEQLFSEKRLPLSVKQKEILVEACSYHNDPLTSNDPTIGTCWDADRLDLPRVGILPDKKLLSTEAGKKFLIW